MAARQAVADRTSRGGLSAEGYAGGPNLRYIGKQRSGEDGIFLTHRIHVRLASSIPADSIAGDEIAKVTDEIASPARWNKTYSFCNSYSHIAEGAHFNSVACPMWHFLSKMSEEGNSPI